VKEAKPLTAKK